MYTGGTEDVAGVEVYIEDDKVIFTDDMDRDRYVQDNVFEIFDNLFLYYELIEEGVFIPTDEETFEVDITPKKNVINDFKKQYILPEVSYNFKKYLKSK